eukprot:m.22020 g.22020  ORF g.22020 m.22020 type:complete len:294 (-) comp8791_c0_seq2:155-1036(-)
MEVLIAVVVVVAATLYLLYNYLFKERRGGITTGRKRRATFHTIRDRYRSIDEVSEAIRKSGLESCNLIVGIDYTKSNEFQGRRTFGGKSLHHVDITKETENPYQKVIRIVGQTLSSFDEDNLIPAFGFGDLTTHGDGVFSFVKNRHCHTFQEVLQRYNELTPMIDLSGPTNFAPLIYKAIDIVKEHWNFHVLLIVADGQVTAPNSTVKAIVEASKYPLSIIMIGVGDGPWDMMKDFDDHLPQRQFDNFQFVNFEEVRRRGGDNPDASFALHALMELPEQFYVIKELNLLNNDI